MDAHIRILELASRDAMPKQINNKSDVPVKIVRELFEAGYLQAIDASSRDGEAFLNTRITLAGREYLRRLQSERSEPEEVVSGSRMSSETELAQIVECIRSLEDRFVDSPSLGLYLSVEDEAEFKRLTIEAKSLLDKELGRDNDFSTNLEHSINFGSGGFLEGPSRAAVKSARAILEGGINQIRRGGKSSDRDRHHVRPAYVDSTRLEELKKIRGQGWDLTRLVRLAEEVNIAHANDCHMATAMLVRAITDHVPPIFARKTFNEVANNYSGSRSFSGSMQHLNASLRNIADAHLHVQVRQSEVLPTVSQVDFRADLDVLLAEVIRILRQT